MNHKLPNPDLEYEGQLELDMEDAIVALHALREYISRKGAEVSENTQRLERKLESYVDRRLGNEKLTVEIDEP